MNKKGRKEFEGIRVAPYLFSCCCYCARIGIEIYRMNVVEKKHCLFWVFLSVLNNLEYRNVVLCCCPYNVYVLEVCGDVTSLCLV